MIGSIVSPKDLLYNYTAPQPPFVYKDLLVNVGTTQNRGFELTLEGDIFKGTRVEWTSGINYSYGTTKLKVLSNDIYHASYIELYQKPGVGSSEHFFRIQEGGKVGQFFGFEYAGVENGNMMVYTDEGEIVSVSDAEKKEISISVISVTEHLPLFSLGVILYVIKILI